MKVSDKNPLEFWGLALGDKSAEMNKRANAAILGTPKPLEEVLFKTGISRGPYSKKSQ